MRMKFSIFLIVLGTLIAESTVVSVKLSDVGHYGTLIRNVHDKHQSAGVIVALGASQLSFDETTFWHEATRMLSNEGISTLILDFERFENRLNFYRERTNKPLIVIVLDTMETLHRFESITKRLDMSYAVWLISFNRDADRAVCNFCHQPHGNTFNLKFNSKILISCCDSTTIEEWWSLEKNRTKTQKVGRLIDGKSEIRWFSHKVLGPRRYSMDGRVLRVAALRLPNTFEERDGNYYGFEGEILQEMSRAMNFTVSKIIWENAYGTWNPETSKWTGVIGRVHRQEADIGFPTFLMTSERYKIVDMTLPIISGFYQLHVRKLDVAHLPWNAHFKALTWNVWMVIIGAILITPVLLTLIKYKRKSHFFPLLFEQYLKVWGIFCQQSLPDFHQEIPSRIVYLSIFVSALVTAGAYSSSIMSSLAVTSSSLPFTTIEEFAKDGTYKLIVLNESLFRDIFQESTRPLMKKMMSLMKPMDSLPRTFEEGFEQVCNDKVAFFTHVSAHKTLINIIPCEITSIRTNKIGSFALIMSRGSEYLHRVNYHIQQFRGSGMFHRLERKYYTKLEQNKLDHPPVHIQGITPILFVLSIGVLCAFLIFIIERNSYPPTKKLRKRKIRIQGRNQKNFNFQSTTQRFPYLE